MIGKRYNVWDIDGTIFLEDHKEGSYHIGQVGNVDINCLNDIAKRLNDLTDENEQLKNRVDELEDDNMKYTLSTDKLEGYTKGFMPTKCINEFRDCKTNRYYWLDNEDNFTGALELLNLLDCENEQLKKENHELHKRLGDFELFERYMKEGSSKTSLGDIIGIVKTDEPTNSVELKGELYK